MKIKLYLVTRQDLPPGVQAVQSCHALRQFGAECPDVDKKWFEESNTLAFLSVPDERELGVLYKKAVTRRLPVAAFREPDLENALTAIALGPSCASLTKGLPLALDDSS
jgi:peptidyl-tRNA hydrolase